SLPESLSPDFEDINVSQITRDIMSMSDKKDSKYLGQMRSRFTKQEDAYLYEKLIISDSDKNKYVANIGQLTLITYARFLATTIYKMQSLFFTKTSPFFVGYNPLGKQYDSYLDILKITDAEIIELTLEWTKDLL